MKRKMILLIFVFVLLFMVTGCGEKKEESNNNQQHNQEEKKDNNNNSNNNSYVVLDDEIIEFDNDDNGPTDEKTVTVEEVINCDGCVYAYFSDEGNKAKTLGATLSPSDYTKDINNLKTAGGKQRHNFFGLVLSGNTISRAYACILKDNKIYCIEGSTNGAYHNSNIAILNKIFTNGQCKTISDGHTYTCTDGSYNGDTKTNGYTSLHYETSCTIYGANSNTGKLICH